MEGVRRTGTIGTHWRRGFDTEGLHPAVQLWL